MFFFFSFFFLASFIVDVSVVSVCLVCVFLHCGHLPFNTSCPLCFLFVFVLSFVLFLVFVVVLSGEPNQNQGPWLGDLN